MWWAVMQLLPLLAPLSVVGMRACCWLATDLGCLVSPREAAQAGADDFPQLYTERQHIC